MIRIRFHAVAAAALVLLSALPAGAQSAQQILETTLERYQQRMQGIENYTLVQEVMGVESTFYFEKEMVDGRPVFQPRAASLGGQAISVQGDQTMSDPYRQFAQLADRARYAGIETVNGQRTHSLVVEDFSGLDINPAPAGGQEGSFTLERMTLYIDTEDHLLRRMEMRGQMSADGRTAPLTMVGTFADYRTTDGLLHPWKTTMSTEGFLEASGMSPEDHERARQQLAELEQQLESMPASQREMMQRVVGGQLAKLREMVESGSMEITTEVREIRVNEGAPRQED